LKSFPHGDNFRVVHEQQFGRHAANRSQRFYSRATPDKVFRPDIAAGMEQAHDFTATCIKPGNIRSLETIAGYSGQSEIIGYGLSSVLPRDNAIDLERRRMKRRWQLAIFTTCSRSLPNMMDDSGVQIFRLLR
jgi:hypothetical protein